MHNVNSLTASWNYLTAQSNGVDTADGSFSDIFGSRLSGMNGTSGIGSSFKDILSKLAERFPNANIKEAEVGEGAKGTEKVFGTEEGDNVAVNSDVLSQMLGSTDLSKKVEEAISSFLESAAGSNAAAGTYSQRTISITITTVRFQVAQRDSETGDLMSSQELQTALQDRIKELVEKFFGGKAVGETESDDEAEDSEKTTAAAKTDETSKDKSGLWGGGYSAMSWSMQLYYSNTMIQSLSDSNSGGAASMMQGFNFSASYQSFSGNFQNFANSFLPETLSSQFGNGKTGNSAFMSLLEGGLGQMGLSSGGFSQTMDGYMLSLRNGRDFLSELLELTGYGKPAAKETDKEEEAEVAQEAPVESEVEM